MRDAESKAERKEELRKIFEPYWRRAVAAAESELRAHQKHVDRVTFLDHMLGSFPQSIADSAAKETLNDREKEDVELIKELAVELCAQLKREAMN